MNKPKLNIIPVNAESTCVNTIHYQPEECLQYFLEKSDPTSQKYEFKTYIATEEKKHIQKTRKWSIPKWIFGGLVFFVLILSLSLLLGASKETITQILSTAVMGVIVGIFKLFSLLFSINKFPEKLLIENNRILLLNNKGKTEMDFPISDIRYVNIVSNNPIKFICFSSKNAKKGDILMNSPVFDISEKEDEEYLLSLLDSFNEYQILGFEIRKFKIGKKK